jgi:hypothetical protein
VRTVLCAADLLRELLNRKNSVGSRLTPSLTAVLTSREAGAGQVSIWASWACRIAGPRACAGTDVSETRVESVIGPRWGAGSPDLASRSGRERSSAGRVESVSGPCRVTAGSDLALLASRSVDCQLSISAVLQRASGTVTRLLQGLGTPPATDRGGRNTSSWAFSIRREPETTLERGSTVLIVRRPDRLVVEARSPTHGPASGVLHGPVGTPCVGGEPSFAIEWLA